MEHVKLKSLSGVAKIAGVALCLAGVLVIALYAGPSMSPVNHHHAFASASHTSSAAHVVTRSAWVKWDIPHGPRQHGMVSLDRPPGQSSSSYLFTAVPLWMDSCSMRSN